MISNSFYRSFFCTAAIFLYSPSLFSSALPFHQQVELSTNLGASSLNFGNSTFVVTNIETDNLHSTKNPWVGQLGVGATYLFPLKEKTPTLNWFPETRLGLNYRYFSNKFLSNTASGQIQQFQDPRMENYSYQLSLSSQRLITDLSLTLLEQKKTSLFVMGGIGYEWNTLRYRDYANPGVEGGNLILNSKSKNRFTAEIGAGMFYQCSERLKASVQYLYNRIGNISTASYGVLNTSPAVIRPASFSLNSNAILFGLNLTI